MITNFCVGEDNQGFSEIKKCETKGLGTLLPN